VSDASGAIDAGTMASLGGLFEGVEPMGLFWTMTSFGKGEKDKDVFNPSFNKSFFMKLDPTTPIDYTISVHLGHQPVTMVTDQMTSSSRLLASKVITKVCMSKGCKRIPVIEGRLRGTLFVPQSTTPLPAILDLYGAPGGLREVRAAMLASHGYVTLALAYFNHADLPKDLTISLDYFLEALEYLQGLPCVSKDGVGILGRCYGGALALHLAVLCPNVKAVVNINGGCYLSQSESVTLKGNPIFHHSDFSRIIYTDEGFIGKPVYPASEQHCVPVEQSSPDCQFLLIYGEDDQMTDAEHGHVIKARFDRWDRSQRSRSTWDHASAKVGVGSATDQWQSENLGTASAVSGDEFSRVQSQQGSRSRCQLIVYPQTGHTIEPPYTPPFRSLWSTYYKTAYLLGGQTKPQAHAQEDAWNRILEFFSKHLHQSSNGAASKL
jgi:dienelactone hydrolase